MIYRRVPRDFKKRFEVVSCFIEYQNRFSLLHRQDHKPEGNTWGVPAGKIDHEEEPIQAVLREINEETGLEIPARKIEYFEKVYVRYPDYDFIYYMYSTLLDQKEEVKINPLEHKSSIWVLPEQALDMNLIPDLDSCIKLFYGLEDR